MLRKRIAEEPEEVAARLPTSEEEAEALPLAMAMEIATPVVHAEDATEKDTAWKRKEARVYEAFAADPKDAKSCICQATKHYQGGICGERIATYTSSLWAHLKAKHKRLHTELKGTDIPSATLLTTTRAVVKMLVRAWRQQRHH